LALSVRRPYRLLIEGFLKRLLELYPNKVISVAVFGSVARGNPTSKSDVDLLIIMKGLGVRSRMKRYNMIVDAINAVEELRVKLTERGVYTGISPVILDLEEAKYFRPLYLDVAYDAIILYDKGGFLESLLKRVMGIVEKYGGKRIWTGRTWHWVFTKGNPLVELCGVKIIE